MAQVLSASRLTQRPVTLPKSWPSPAALLNLMFLIETQGFADFNLIALLPSRAQRIKLNLHGAAICFLSTPVSSGSLCKELNLLNIHGFKITELSLSLCHSTDLSKAGCGPQISCLELRKSPVSFSPAISLDAERRCSEREMLSFTTHVGNRG